MLNFSYTVVYEYFKEEGEEGYNVIVPALPGCITWGKTLKEAKENARDAIQFFIRKLMKSGEPIPDDLANELRLVEIEKVSVEVDPKQEVA
jgi:antitoxin HicB